MLTLLRQTVILKNYFDTSKGVVLHRGQRPYLVKIMLSWTQTSPWIDGLYNNFAQMVPLMRLSFAQKNDINTIHYKVLSDIEVKHQNINIDETEYHTEVLHFH